MPVARRSRLVPPPAPRHSGSVQDSRYPGLFHNKLGLEPDPASTSGQRASKQQRNCSTQVFDVLTIPGKALAVWRCRSLLTLAPVAGSAGLRLDLSVCRNVASVLFSNQALSPTRCASSRSGRANKQDLHTNCWDSGSWTGFSASVGAVTLLARQWNSRHPSHPDKQIQERSPGASPGRER